MSIFLEKYPLDNLKKFFFDIMVKHNDEYYFDINLYKKANFFDKIKPFVKSLKPYYKENKQFYIERTVKYKSFMTIIRQLCNSHNIIYSNKIKYSNNSYTIEYYFIL